jgi:hypothetical protein
MHSSGLSQLLLTDPNAFQHSTHTALGHVGFGDITGQHRLHGAAEPFLVLTHLLANFTKQGALTWTAVALHDTALPAGWEGGSGMIAGSTAGEPHSLADAGPFRLPGV